MVWEELNESLVTTGVKANDYTDVMKSIGSMVINEGYAKDSYIDALIEREKEYPTGLDMDGVGVAIPHTAVEHVKKQGIAIAVLDKPVTFLQMGTDDETVEVQLIFMLAVVNANEHLDQLQTILSIIQDKTVLQKLMRTKDAKQIIEIIKEKENSL